MVHSGYIQCHLHQSMYAIKIFLLLLFQPQVIHRKVAVFKTNAKWSNTRTISLTIERRLGKYFLKIKRTNKIEIIDFTAFIGLIKYFENSSWLFISKDLILVFFVRIKLWKFSMVLFLSDHVWNPSYRIDRMLLLSVSPNSNMRSSTPGISGSLLENKTANFFSVENCLMMNEPKIYSIEAVFRNTLYME